MQKEASPCRAWLAKLTDRAFIQRRQKSPVPYRDGGPCYHPVSPARRRASLIRYAGIPHQYPIAVSGAPGPLHIRSADLAQRPSSACFRTPASTSAGFSLVRLPAYSSLPRSYEEMHCISCKCMYYTIPVNECQIDPPRYGPAAPVMNCFRFSASHLWTWQSFPRTG